MQAMSWWAYVLLASPGIFIFVMNWSVFIHNMRGGKFVSGIPLIGGLWIAVACLISPWKWLALIGFADTGVWMLIAALFLEFFPWRKKNSEE